MRKIKFRAWDDKENKMLDWEYLREYCDIDFLFGGAYEREKGHPYPYPIAMQYTGLKDKNGIEIYEGDILTDHGDEGPLYMEYSNKHAGFVFVDKFDPYGTTLYTTIQISYEGFEVIGNIYENPELLEESK